MKISKIWKTLKNILLKFHVRTRGIKNHFSVLKNIHRDVAYE